MGLEDARVLPLLDVLPLLPPPPLPLFVHSLVPEQVQPVMQHPPPIKHSKYPGEQPQSVPTKDGRKIGRKKG